MIKLLQDAIRVIWEILLPVPMPWRAGLIVLVIVLFLYWSVWRSFPWLIEKLARLLLFLAEGITSLLLLPEYWITKLLRQSGRRPLPGSYAFGDVLQGVVSLIHTGITKLADAFEGRWRLSKWWVVLILATPILLWYVRPSLGETTVANYIDRGVAWWYSLEGWALTGEWVSPIHVVPTISPGATSPAPSGSTVTPRPTTTPGVRVTPSSGPTRTCTATPTYTIYTVQPGDSLSKIAKKFGVSVEDIVEANREKYPSLVTDRANIEVGWELLVPRQE